MDAQIDNDEFLDYDSRHKALVAERLAWQQEHPKPWYLARRKSDLYRKNHNN